MNHKIIPNNFFMFDRLFLKRLQSFMTGLMFLTTLFLIPQLSQAQDVVTLVKPQAGEMVFAKKPEVQLDIATPFDTETLYIEFDGIDMTALADSSENRITFKPVQVVMPGEHTVRISFSDKNGEEHSKEFSFSSRHSKIFEEVYSTNNISFTYKNILKRTNDAKDREMSDWEFDANLNSQSFIKEGPWEFSLETNARYSDRELGLEDPIEPGVEFTDYIIRGKYEKDDLTVKGELGDIQVSETRNTISGLSRRGGKLSIETQTATLGGFVVRSDQIYGFDGEYGLKIDDDDHIYGIAGSLSLLDNRLNIKTVYATGGEENDNSYSVWPAEGGSKGNVFGIEIITDFFEQKLVTTFEWDKSDYDTDTSDDISSKSDTAVIADISGSWDRFNYQATYEHTGPDYKVAGNYIQADWEGIALNGGVTFETQSVNLSYSNYNDNVDKDDDRAVNHSTEYRLDYNLSAIERLPISFSASKSINKSSREPFPSDETDDFTNTYGGNITYQIDEKGEWSLGLSPEYSKRDDKTVNDYDTSSKTLMLTASFTKEKFSISPSIRFNRFKDYSTRVESDTVNYDLSFNIYLLEGLELSGNGGYGTSYVDDHTVDEDSFYGDLQLTYSFESPISILVSPSIMLKATHSSTDDKLFDGDSNETIIFILLTGNLELSF